MTNHLLNCFACNARQASSLKTGRACLLVETNQGPTLVDTGVGLNDYINPTQMTRLFRIITITPFDPDEAAVHQGEGLGCKSEDIRHIILTHMHFDYCCGMSDYPFVKVHVHRREYDAFTDRKTLHWAEFAYIPRYITHRPDFDFYDKGDSKWYDFNTNRPPFEPEMYFIPLHGHSRGHCGVAIKTANSWFFHAGDAGAVYDNETPAQLIKMVLGPHDTTLRTFMNSHPEVVFSNSHLFPGFFIQLPTIV